MPDETNKGRLVGVYLTYYIPQTQGRRTIVGRVVGASGNAITIQVVDDDEPLFVNHTIDIPWTSILLLDYGATEG